MRDDGIVILRRGVGVKSNGTRRLTVTKYERMDSCGVFRLIWTFSPTGF